MITNSTCRHCNLIHAGFSGGSGVYTVQQLLKETRPASVGLVHKPPLLGAAGLQWQQGFLLAHGDAPNLFTAA